MPGFKNDEGEEGKRVETIKFKVSHHGWKARGVLSPQAVPASSGHH